MLLTAQLNVELARPLLVAGGRIHRLQCRVIGPDGDGSVHNRRRTVANRIVGVERPLQFAAQEPTSGGAGCRRRRGQADCPRGHENAPRFTPSSNTPSSSSDQSAVSCWGNGMLKQCWPTAKSRSPVPARSAPSPTSFSHRNLCPQPAIQRVGQRFSSPSNRQSDATSPVPRTCPHFTSPETNAGRAMAQQRTYW